MATLLAVLLAALAFALCSLREATPEARTPAQMRDAARRAGWRRCTGRALLLAGVPALYVLAAGCWMCWHAARGACFFLGLIAAYLDTITSRPRLEHA